MFRVVQQFVVVEDFDPEWELVIDDAGKPSPLEKYFCSERDRGYGPNVD